MVQASGPPLSLKIWAMMVGYCLRAQSVLKLMRMEFTK